MISSPRAATRTVKIHRVRAFVQTDDIAEIAVRTLYRNEGLQIRRGLGATSRRSRSRWVNPALLWRRAKPVTCRASVARHRQPRQQRRIRGEPAGYEFREEPHALGLACLALCEEPNRSV